MMIYILFVCIVAPLALMLFLLDKNARYTVGFMIIGIFMCLFVSEVNGLLLGICGGNTYYTTTTITPVTEEIVKALPILFFGFVISDERERLVSVSMAVGIGFAVLENCYILVGAADSVTIFWALIRGFGAGLMHGICTSFVGLGVSFVRKKKKLFYTGTFGLLISAIIYHSIYNTLVQSRYEYIGFLLPIITYVPLLFAVAKVKKAAAAKKNA